MEDDDVENNDFYTNLEKEMVNRAFKNVGIDNYPPRLYNALQDYLDVRMLETTQPGQIDYKQILFMENKNDIMYRGFMILGIGLIDEKPCLNISHVMISPRGGNLLNSNLKLILENNQQLQSILIKDVISRTVRSKFQINGWKIMVDGSVYLKKQGGGKKKRSSSTKKYRRKRIRKRRSYKQL